MEIQENIKEIIFIKFNKSQETLKKCSKVINKLSNYYAENSYTMELKVDFAKSFYEQRKKIIYQKIDFITRLSQKLINSSGKVVEHIMNCLKSNKFNIDNEAFVDDLDKMIDYAKKQNDIQKFGSKVIIDYFLNFVVDQYELSKIETMFYQNLITIIRELPDKTLINENLNIWRCKWIKNTLQIIFD